MSQQQYRKKLITLIHVAKSKLGMDDETYRAMLLSITDKRSCTDMTIDELKAVKDGLQARGFKAMPSANKSPKSRGRRVDKLRAIWIEMHKSGQLNSGSEQALLHWAQKTVAPYWEGEPAPSLDWLENNHTAVNHALESLKRWQKRASQTG